MLISIVVPIFNAKDSLNRCVDSILKQTHTDLEIILVNDGSTDGSDVLCEELSLQDSRIKVFHKRNGGASSARNYGLNRAHGEYVGFVDCDDYIDPNYVELLIPDNLAGITVCSILYEGEKSFVLRLPNIVYNINVFSDTLSIILEAMPVCSPCCKLYDRNQIIANFIEFDENVSAGEDMLFVFKYIGTGLQNIKFVDLPLYHYCTSPDSLSHKIIPFETTLYVMDAIITELNKISERYQWENNYTVKTFIASQVVNMINNIKSETSLLTKCKQIRIMLRNSNVAHLLSDTNYLLAKIHYNGMKRLVSKALIFILGLYYKNRL